MPLLYVYFVTIYQDTKVGRNLIFMSNVRGKKGNKRRNQEITKDIRKEEYAGMEGAPLMIKGLRLHFNPYSLIR